MECKWSKGFRVQGSGFRVQRVQRVQRRRWRFSPHIYMRRCPKAGRLHPCPLLLKSFPKIKKLFSIVKSFSIFGNLFTILNSLNMERKGGTPMLHPFCLIENDAIVIVSFCRFVSLLRFRICAVGGTKRCSGGFSILFL